MKSIRFLPLLLLISLSVFAEDKAAPTPAPTSVPAPDASAPAAPKIDFKTIASVCGKGETLSDDQASGLVLQGKESDLKELISGKYGALSIEQISQCKLTDDLPPNILFAAAKVCNLDLIKNLVSLGANPWLPLDHYLGGAQHDLNDLAVAWATKTQISYGQMLDNLQDLQDLFVSASGPNAKYGYCINIPKDSDTAVNWQKYLVENDDGEPMLDDKGNYLFCADKKENMESALKDNIQQTQDALEPCKATVDYLIKLLDGAPKPAQK